MKLNPLTPEEEKVIVGKGTEPPFSGEYDKFFQNGTYICRRCGAPLYRSENKFDSKCGWPSFDDEIPGAVKRIPDPDGQRTEIICANCGAHLGHVFEGEKMTSKNVRHCVNSISLKFIPKEKQETAVFAGGCFWCTEAVFKKIKGVLDTAPVYVGGTKENPSYEEVSGGKTGYVEAIKIQYDPTVVSYEDLLEVFFYTHDPTSLDKQGNDIGRQYRSVIFYVSEKQKKAAEEFIRKLEEEKVYSQPIITELKPLGKFYPAEEYHRDYYAKHAEASYCRVVISPKLKKLAEKYQRLLK